MKHKPSNILKLLAITLAGLIVAGALYCEWVGLPGIMRHAVQSELETRGLAADAENIRGGLFTGLVFEGLTVWDGQGEERGRMFTAESMAFHPRPLPLLAGKLSVRQIIISGGAVFFPSTEFETSPNGTAPRVINELNGRIRFTDSTISIPRVEVDLAGARLELDGEIRNWRRAIPDTLIKPGGDALGWASLLDHMPEAYNRNFELARKYARRQMLLREESFLRATFDIDLSKPYESSARGLLQISEITVRDLPVRTLKARLTLKHGILYIPELKLQAGFKTSINAQAQIDLIKGTVHGRLQSQFNPQLIYSFMELPMPRWLAEVRLPTLPHFDLTVATSPLDPLKWAVSGTVRARNVLYRTSHLRSLSANLQRIPGSIQLNNLDLKFDSPGNEFLQGNLTLSEADDPRLSGKVHGTISPRTFLHFFPAASHDLRTPAGDLIFDQGLPQFECTFNDSGLTRDTCRLNLKLQAANFSFRDLQVAKLEVPVVLENRILTSRDNGILVKAGTEEQQSINASVSLDLNHKRVTASGMARIYPERLIKALRLPGQKLAADLKLHGPPAKISFKLNESPWPDPRAWTMNFEVEAENASYDKLHFDRAAAKGQISRWELQLSEVVAESEDVEQLEISELTLALDHPELTLKGVCKADPLAFEVFLPKGQPRRVYRKIWKDFDWGDSHPRGDFDNLHFKEFPSGRWLLAVQAHITDEETAYRGIPTDTVEVDLDLRLPAKVSLKNLRVSQGQRHLNANLHFALQGDPVLTFDGTGKFDPFTAFSALGPEVARRLQPLRVHDTASTSLKGSVHLRGDARPRLEGQLEGEWLTYHSIRFDDFRADWQMVEHELKWNLSQATLNGGKASVRGFHNSFFGNGHLEVDIRDAQLSGLIGQLRKKEMEQDFGLISGQATVTLHDQKGSKPMLMNGDGEIHVRNGQLWDAPILQQLGQTLGLSTLGRISELDAPLSFRGDKVVVNEFTTDGTILALSGNGDYNWGTNSMRFTVYGQALKTTSFIPLVTKPLSWFFQAELEGTPQDYDWKLLGPLRRMLPGGN